MRACWHPTDTVVVIDVQMKQTVLIVAPRMTYDDQLAIPLGSTVELGSVAMADQMRTQEIKC